MRHWHELDVTAKNHGFTGPWLSSVKSNLRPEVAAAAAAASARARRAARALASESADSLAFGGRQELKLGSLGSMHEMRQFDGYRLESSPTGILALASEQML